MNPLNPNRTYLIDVDLLKDNPWQTRQGLDRAHIKALAEDIRARGLMQPPMGRLVPSGTRVLGNNDLSSSLRYKNAHIELAFGHNRVAAYKLLAKQDDNYRLVPVQIRELTDIAMANMAWSENSARKDLNPVEEALAIEKRCQDFEWSQKRVSQELGLSASAISNKLRLLRLPADVKDEVKRGEMSERQAMALVPLFDLPALALEKARNSYYSPDKIRREAQELSSEEIRQQVKQVFSYVSKSLDMAPWPIKKPLMQDDRFSNATCDTCEFYVKKGKRCLNTSCYEAKKEVWKAKVLSEASQAIGIKVVPDDFSWSRASEFDWQGKDYCSEIPPCPNLRLQFISIKHGALPEFFRGWPQTRILCYHGQDNKCTCLAAVLKEVKQQEREKREASPEYQEEKRKKKKIRTVLDGAESQIASALINGNQFFWLKMLQAIDHNQRGKGEKWTTEQISHKLAKYFVGGRYNDAYEAQEAMSRLLTEAGLKLKDMRLEKLEQQLAKVERWFATVKTPSAKALRGNIDNLSALAKELASIDTERKEELSNDIELTKSSLIFLLMLKDEMQ